MPTLAAKIHIPEDVLFHELGGETVLLNTATGKYFGLDDVGTRMWSLIAEHGQLQLAFHALLQEYAVDGGPLEADLLELVDQLAAHGLLELEAE